MVSRARATVPAHHAVWSLSGRFEHWIYGPQGEAQGLMLQVTGCPVQFVVSGPDQAVVAALQPGRHVTLEGSFEGEAESPGGGRHQVYRFVRLGGTAAAETRVVQARGRVARFNHARHGEPNGVVLDTGDFVHTRPHGLAALNLKVGDEVRAHGPARPLFNGAGRVIEAQQVNGQACA